MKITVTNPDCFASRTVNDINRSAEYPGREGLGGVIYQETPTSPKVRIVRAANYWGEKSLQSEDGRWFLPHKNSTIEY